MTTDNPRDTTLYDLRHKELLLPVVRVRAPKGTGSGTVIYSGPDKAGTGFSTYVLTNHHVVESAIEFKDEWSALLKRKTKIDVLGVVEAEFFEYQWNSRAVGATSVLGQIAAYDVNEDLALIRLNTTRQVPDVARLLPKGQELLLRASMPLFAVGAGMGEAPVITAGMLSQFGMMIGNREFWVSTAPTIFGNSGGALFLADTNEFIGVPARLIVAMLGMSVDAITHLSWAIPITRVYEFLDAQVFQFIYDSKHTEAGDEAQRKAMRERDSRQVAQEEVRSGEVTS